MNRRTIPIDRASAEDVVSLATDVGPSPTHIGAVVSLGGPPLDRSSATETLGRRIERVPRLRQRLVATPLGCGRPVWIDDPCFDPTDHIGWAECPAPGDEEALLSLAADLVTDPLPKDRALWRATFVDGLCGGGTALVVAVHHVLVDGLRGLAVLGSLVDGLPDPLGTPFPRPAPTSRHLAKDAAYVRVRAVRRWPATIHDLVLAVADVRRWRGITAPRTSINRPTGRRRRFAVTRIDLADVQAAAHLHGVTVNDVVLTAIGGALGRVLAHRSEPVEHLVVSMPVAARATATSTDLGNHVDVAPVPVPTRGTEAQRLHEVAGATRVAKRSASDRSAALLHGAFRLLAALGLLGPAIRRQRLVNTFVTNLHGPSEPMSMMDRPITDVVAISPISGNVGLAAAVLSYAGSLDVTLVADPEVCPDLDALQAALAHELGVLTRLGDDADASRPVPASPTPADQPTRSHHARHRRVRVHVRKHPPDR